MKKGSKLKNISRILFILLTCGGLVIAHVALKKKCDDLIKQKVLAEEELKHQIIKQNNLFANYQHLISEERIIPTAAEKLGMIIADPPISIVTIDKEKLEDLQALLERQHD